MTSFQTRKCPECFYDERVNAKHCSECGYDFNEVPKQSKQRFDFIKRVIFRIRAISLKTIVTVSIFLFVWFYMIPAPYSLGYLLKRVFYKESGQCADGTYTFAFSSQGACSGHGGVEIWFKDDY